MTRARPPQALVALPLLLLALAPAPAAAVVFDGSGFQGLQPPFQTPSPAPVPGCTTYRCAELAILHVRAAAASLNSCQPHMPSYLKLCPFHSLSRYSQRLDHFSRHDKRRWQQRYTLCTAYWNPRAKRQGLYMYLGERGDGFQALLRACLATDGRLAAASCPARRHSYLFWQLASVKTQNVSNMSCWLTASLPTSHHDCPTSIAGNESPLPGAWPTIFSDMARDEGGLLLYAGAAAATNLDPAPPAIRMRCSPAC